MKHLITLGICNYLSMNDSVIKTKFLQPSNNVTTKEESNPNRPYQLSYDRTEISLKLN